MWSRRQAGRLQDRYLSGSAPEGSRAARPDSPFLSEKNLDETYLERARALNEIAGARGQTLAQLALSWVLRDDRVTSALVGARSVRRRELHDASLSARPQPPAEAGAP